VTDAQRRFFERSHTRIARLSPDVAAEFLRAIRILAASMSEAELARLIASGAVGHIVAALMADTVLDPALSRFRSSLHRTMERSFDLNTPYLPNAGKVRGIVAVQFDHLNPRVLDALRTLDSQVIPELKQALRDGVTQRIALGLERQESPGSIARGVRELIGLPPRLVTAVENFRTMLESKDSEALARELRDKRFDGTISKAFAADGPGLKADQIDRMVAAYRRQALASNAETVSTTATKTAYKLAQRESWLSAVDRGIVRAGSLEVEWVGVVDGHQRPEHERMTGERRAFDQPYSNGDSYAGENDPWGCRCLDRVLVA